MSEFEFNDASVAAIRTPPHSIEAEQSVLGGLLLDNSAWEKVADLLTDGDFYRHDHRIIFRHIIPNGIAPILVNASLALGGVIVLESALSFLGLGVQPPTATWGNMLEGAYNYIETAPWLWAFPGTLIVLTVLSINFVGDGLRDALDPQQRSVIEARGVGR